LGIQESFVWGVYLAAPPRNKHPKTIYPGLRLIISFAGKLSESSCEAGGIMQGFPRSCVILYASICLVKWQFTRLECREAENRLFGVFFFAAKPQKKHPNTIFPVLA
jgi:hypothetical protein